MNVYRNGVLLGPVFNTGAHTDVLNTAGGTFVYKVCERGTTNCSNSSPVTF
jgi:serine protease